MIVDVGRCAPVAKYFPVMVGETGLAAIALRACNPRPAGPSKTRNQSPLGRFQHVPCVSQYVSVCVTDPDMHGSSSRMRRLW